MSIKVESRKRRAKKIRAKTTKPGKHRLTVIKSNKHLSAQIILSENHQHKVVAQVSSMEKQFKDTSGNKTEIATTIGKTLAQRLSSAGVDAISFDRAGYKYHGRVKALADAVREGGIQF
jgi:large subunit ribosomal protein L18